jgi:hypothetical protein
MALTLPLYGTQAKVYIHSTTVTIATTGSMVTTTTGAALSGIEYTAEIKDWKISGGERSLEAIKLLGYSEQPNYKRATIMEVSGTLLFRDIDVWEMICGSGSTTNLGGTTETYTPTTGVKRIHFGEKATNDRVPRAVYLTVFTASGNVMVFLMNGAIMTLGSDITINSEDAIEQSVTFQCLASNCWAEEVTSA